MLFTLNLASMTLALWLTAKWTSLSPIATLNLRLVLFTGALNYVFITYEPYGMVIILPVIKVSGVAKETELSLVENFLF